MAPYTGYFDESGSENESMFVFGGLVRDSADLQKFDAEWHAAIDPLPFLHTSQFLAGKSEGYELWNSMGLQWKQDILTRASAQVAKRACATFAIALDMADFRQISTEAHFDQAIGHPYAFCSRFGTVQVNDWGRHNRLSDPVHIVFEDRGRVDRSDLRAVFDRDKLPHPEFIEKSIPALQAADLISVIHARKTMNKDNFVQVAPALKEFYRHLHTSDYLPYVRLREISERVRRLITVCETPPGQKPGFYFESAMDKPRRKFGKQPGQNVSMAKNSGSHTPALTGFEMDMSTVAPMKNAAQK
jgi:hypothetical protein